MSIGELSRYWFGDFVMLWRPATENVKPLSVGMRGADVRWLAWALTMFAGLTMVSNLKFYSGKDINLRKSVPFSVVVGIAMGLIFLVTFQNQLPEILFALFMGYGLSGYVIWVWEAVKGTAKPPPAAAG